MLIPIMASGAATSASSSADQDVLLWILGGVFLLVIAVFIAGRAFKKQDPEINEEFPIPLDERD